MNMEMEAASSSLPSPPPEVKMGASTERTFPFDHLPIEIRDLIWEFSLPPARIFHVKGTYSYVANMTAQPRRAFYFHIHHEPPAATKVCKESRAVALRLGGFVFALNPTKPGPWFNPQCDILYIDRNQRAYLTLTAIASTRHVPGWDQVLHVGVEWRAWFRDVPHRQPGQDMRRDWRAAIRGLYVRMPHLKGIHYVLPRVRHSGGVTGGREPYGASKYPTELLTLPPTTTIPWYKKRGNGNAAPGTGAAILEQMREPAGDSLRPYLATWEHIRGEMERAMDSDDSEDDGDDDGDDDDYGSGEGSGEVKGQGEEGHKQGQEHELDWTIDEFMDHRKASNQPWGDRRPKIVGWWLLRCGAPVVKEEDPQVREFLL